MSVAPHPNSAFHVGDRLVELKVHRCLWSGTYSENSPRPIEECAREGVVVTDAAEIFHSLGLKLDIWTLDADTPRWRERFARIVAAGADIVTTNTAIALAAAARGLT